YTTILNQLLNEDNIVADIMDKTYLVPAFVHPREEGSFDRFFPTMSTPEGKSYVPVFSNLLSFEKWYNHNDFGGAFRKAQGVILAWTIDDIYKPRNGENEIDDTFGVAINPFDEQQVLVDWSDVEND
ncbi:SseB family protein, partial [Streptococcus agalactiae]